MTLDAHGYDVQLVDGYTVVCDAWASGATPPERLTVSQWADRYRIIGDGAGAEPGPWRTARNPPLREIMDALSDHSPVSRVDFMKSAQIGATEVGINFAGYVIDRGLDSMIVAQPVKELARSWVVSKFDPAIAAMPALTEKLASDNTFEKLYPGGTLWAIWANSSNQLRQRTARYIFGDEVDEYPRDLNDQGGAQDQLSARAMSFGDRAKEYYACTPTVAGRSNIEAGHRDGDRRVYLVQCPECGAHQPLHRDRLLPSGAFACAVNGCIVEEHHKERILRERAPCADCGEHKLRVIDHVRADGTHAYADDCGCGRTLDPAPPDGAFWQPTNPAAPSLRRSYHMWTAYAPEGLGPSWTDIAAKRAAAEANPDKLASLFNLIYGEPFEGERKEQDAAAVEQLAEPGVNLGDVPDGALILTCGVDCQHDRFELQIVGHGRGQRARIIDYVVVDGDPSRPDGYADLDAYLQRTWAKHNGRSLHLSSIAIDGGNWTEMVAQYVKSKVTTSGQSRIVQVGGDYRRQTIYLVRGRSESKSERAVYRPHKTEVNQRDKTLARSVGVWGVGTSVLKHIVFGWITSAVSAKEKAESAGEAEDIAARMLRFPGGRGEPWNDLTPDVGMLPPKYYKGLTCEYFDIDAERWITPRGARNEPLDTLVYALWAALAPAIKIDAMREPQWAALEAEFEPAADLFNVTSSSTNVPRETKTVPASVQPARPKGRNW